MRLVEHLVERDYAHLYGLVLIFVKRSCSAELHILFVLLVLFVLFVQTILPLTKLNSPASSPSVLDLP